MGKIKKICAGVIAGIMTLLMSFYAEYEGKIVMTTTNFDTEKTVPIKIQYKGKDVPVFTQMRTMEQINGSYVLEPFKPIFIQFDI